MQCQRRLQISRGKEYWQRFRLKLGGGSPSPTLGWAFCSNFAIAAYSLLVDGFIFLQFY